MLSEGRAGDGHSAHLMLGSLMPGSIFLAYRAYDADKLRKAIARKGAFAKVSPMPQRPAAQPSAIPLPATQSGRRLLQQDQALPSHRTRYDKRHDNVLASVQLAAIRIGLRHKGTVT